MPTRKNEAAEVAQRLIGILETQRSLGNYPISLAQLIELAAPASSELAGQAIRNKAFTQRAIVALKDNSASPVALADDRDLLAGSPQLLYAILESVCTAESPACPLTKLKTKLHPHLKQPFDLAVKSHVERNTLPAAVGHFIAGKTINLYLQRYGKPKKPEESLAEKLVQALRSARESGESYPMNWQRLIEKTGPHTAGTLIAKAQKQSLFTQNVFAVGTKLTPSTPVALIDDADRLAGDPVVLEFAIRASRTAANQVFAIAVLKNKLATRLRAPFALAVQRAVEAAALPAGAGCLLAKSKPLFFLVDDLRLASGAVLPPLAALPVQPEDLAKPRAATDESSFDFPAAFDEAFTRLDRQAGSLNFVNLVGLRRAIPLDRETFDRELRRLRLTGRFGLSAAEGRHGISPEEREAGINEEGSLLLFVSRKSP